jgi:glutamate--cysteine ligase
MTAAARDALAADLARRAFGGSPGRGSLPPRIGAEVELIPVDADTRQRCWSLPWLRHYGAGEGWREWHTAKGSPCFLLPCGGMITFEPGGQVEYSTPPVRSAGALLALLDRVVPPLRAAAAVDGIEMLAVGIDPYNPIERAPLVLGGSRYERMADYFSHRHPAGARMMRQTAAFQLSLDSADDPWLRWRVLNAAAPYFVAIFATSPVYAGEPTGCPSARAGIWRALDPTRTGLPYCADDPVGAYLDFALAAPAILLPAPGGEHRRFEEWLGAAPPSTEAWAAWNDHLSTLFPEVRPRGHLELRSCDAIPPECYAAAVALAVGITYAAAGLPAAAELLGPPDPALLERAGRLGLRDRSIAATAADLVGVALEGCASLGPRYFRATDLDRARAFFDRYTRRGRAPADDTLAPVSTPSAA